MSKKLWALFQAPTREEPPVRISKEEAGARKKMYDEAAARGARVSKLTVPPSHALAMLRKASYCCPKCGLNDAVLHVSRVAGKRGSDGLEVICADCGGGHN